MTETDIPATSIYLTPAARRRQFAVSGGGVAVLTALAALSYFSGDPHNTTYYLFAAVDLYFICRLARELRHYLRGAPEIHIDESGLRLFYPSRLFWPWSRIKGARATGAQVIVALHRPGGIDQGVRDRTEVSLRTPPSTTRRRRSSGCWRRGWGGVAAGERAEPPRPRATRSIVSNGLARSTSPPCRSIL